MERLTKRLPNGMVDCTRPDITYEELQEKVCEFEDAMENRTLLKLTDLEVTWSNEEWFIEGKLKTPCCIDFIPIAKFDSREAAEARLKELQESGK